MDNRRPPKSNSSGPGKYYGRSRGEPGDRQGPPRRTESGNTDRPAHGDGQGAPPRGRGPATSRPGNRNPRFNSGPASPRNRFGVKLPVSKSKVPPKAEPEIKITSDLQITDGKFKGKFFGASASPKSKPMPRGVRDSMFRIIARRVRAGRFLDLCTGCGTVGIEAISRGAMLSTFVERSARSVALLRKNLAEMGIRDGHSEIIEMEAVPYVRRSAVRKRMWDVVFVSYTGEPSDAELLELVSRGQVIAPGGIAVIEHSPLTPLPEKLNALTQWRTLTKDGVALGFYNRK